MNALADVVLVRRAYSLRFYKFGSTTTVAILRRLASITARTRTPLSFNGAEIANDGVDMEPFAAIDGYVGNGVPTFRLSATHRRAGRAPIVRIRLTRKLADHLDGVDVSGYAEGDVIALERSKAELLIAEGWALPYRERERRERRYVSCLPVFAEAADAHRAEPHPHRRADDRLRDELHDQRARILNRDE